MLLVVGVVAVGVAVGAVLVGFAQQQGFLLLLARLTPLLLVVAVRELLLERRGELEHRGLIQSFPQLLLRVVGVAVMAQLSESMVDQVDQVAVVLVGLGLLKGQGIHQSLLHHKEIMVVLEAQ